ncbi:MAG: pilus assembly protein [Cellvibrionaceae bacterium]|nr:pilus assembly protein [Cellvibrionaceae bacterium]MCV6626847.1 pilus assembly protein [Cellvibrionaceae bacterium]
MNTMPQFTSVNTKQRGSSIIEMTVAMGIFITLGLGGWQWGLLYEAKATARHAAFMAARAAAKQHADVAVIRRTFARYLAPYYAPESDSDLDIGKVVAEHTAALTTPDNLEVKILNPVREAFSDFGKDLDQDGVAEEIPNIDINFMAKDVKSSQLNIQDANLLKVQLVYGVPLDVPYMGEIFASTLKVFTPENSADPGKDKINKFKRQLLDNKRMPILISTTVRMQSYAKLNDAMVSRNQAASNASNILAADEPEANSNEPRPTAPTPNIFIGAQGGGGNSHNPNNTDNPGDTDCTG